MASIKKNDDIERYDIRTGNGWDWAVVCISKTGLFMVESSYGNYAHWWSNHGRETFKHFILELERDPHYVMSKFGRRDSFELEPTIKEMKRQLLEYRRQGNWTKEDTRYAYDTIKNELSEINSADLFIQQVYKDDLLKEFYQDFDSLPIVYDYDIQLRGFMKHIFPIFVEEIKKELKQCQEAGTNQNSGTK